MMDVAELIETLRLTVVPFDRSGAFAAWSIYTRFGKGFHPAKLNLLDCISYALAERLGMSLLTIPAHRIALRAALLLDAEHAQARLRSRNSEAMRARGGDVA
jgi:hypothetical protein